jgi:hypothetical protein
LDRVQLLGHRDSIVLLDVDVRREAAASAERVEVVASAVRSGADAVDARDLGERRARVVRTACTRADYVVQACGEDLQLELRWSWFWKGGHGGVRWRFAVSGHYSCVHGGHGSGCGGLRLDDFLSE